MTTAFVFAGGGSLGAVQVGALRELVRAGERPDLVVGASVGALNACFFAARPNEEGVAALERIWIGIKRRDIFPLTLSGALGWLRGGDSLFESRALRALIERHLPIAQLEEASLPVHVVATDLSGATVCLSQGDATDAVLASAAIPIALPSVRIGMNHLMDGAIAGNTPILTAAELGATRIIVLQTGYACSLAGPPSGAVARGMHALTLLISNQMERDLRLLEGKAQIHVAPHLCPLDVSPFNFDHSQELIARAAHLTRIWIDGGGLGRSDGPEALHHEHEAMTAPAAGGFDVVALFAGQQVWGAPEFSAEHEGRFYHFADAVHRELFLADPARYAPQYDGLCAFAMARGKRVAGDPRCFRVVDGRLFFNLNAQVQRRWERDTAPAIRRADGFWRGDTTRTRES